MNQNTLTDIKGNILVVDDTPVNLRLLSELLTKQGYRVRAARDGQTAIRSVQTHHPDLILLDIKMPEMDGYEVCTHLKQGEITADIPIIFISALSEADDIVRAFEVGGVDYITKPFKFREVLARVENHLTLQRQRQQIEQAQQRERQYFEKISTMKDHFVQAATHDLKSPLAMIMGYASLLDTQESIIGDQEAMTYIAEIKRGSDKMLGLVREMLDLLQIESGIHLQAEPTELNALVRQATTPFSQQAAGHNLTLEMTLPEADRTVFVDAEKLTRVFDNLISNAIKYTPAGGDVVVEVEHLEDAVGIHIRDNGIGISAEALPMLFEAFYRVRDKSTSEINVEGTGLGLSIARSIVEQHNGSIEVNSQPGAGSTFSVYLPYSDSY